MIKPEIPKFISDAIKKYKYQNKPIDNCLIRVYIPPTNYTDETIYYIKFLQHDESSYFLADCVNLSNAYRWHISNKYVRFFKDRVLTPVFTMQEIDDNFPQFKKFAIPVDKDEEVDV